MNSNQLLSSAGNVVQHVVKSRGFWDVILNIAKEAAAIEAVAYPPAGAIATGVLHIAQGMLDHYLPAEPQPAAPSATTTAVTQGVTELAKEVIQQTVPAAAQPIATAVVTGVTDALAGMPGETS